MYALLLRVTQLINVSLLHEIQRSFPDEVISAFSIARIAIEGCEYDKEVYRYLGNFHFARTRAVPD